MAGQTCFESIKPTDGNPWALGCHPWALGPARGFTLLELLVAVAVISLLVSILMTAMGPAREAGRAAHCAATLHNAGLAMTHYLDDNDGWFWPYALRIGGAEPGQQWWFGFEPGGPASNPWQGYRPLDKTRGFLAPYLAKAADDFICPSFPYGQGMYFPKFSPPAGGYGYNMAALSSLGPTASPNPGSRRIDAFGSQAAVVFALADGLHFDRLDYSSNPPLEQPFNEPPYIQWQDPALFGSNFGVQGGYGHFRHNGRATVLFLDSHVAAQPVRRPLHPYSHKGYGPVANLSDEALRVQPVALGPRTLNVDIIYGLRE